MFLSLQILNMFRENRELFDVFYFIKCGKCNQRKKVDLLDKNNVMCRGQILKTTETNFFVIIPIEKQIIKSVKDNWSSICEFGATCNKQSESFSDAHDGAILKNLLNKYSESDTNILSLTLNVDGAKKFKSNLLSVWPIQLIQNFLPPTIRYQLRNIIVNGFFYTNSESDELNFHDFLMPLISELNHFHENPISLNIENQDFNFIPIITHAAVDLPAKGKLQETKQFGGYFGCSYCEIPGELVDVQIKSKKKKGTKPTNDNKKSKNSQEEPLQEQKTKKFIRYVESDSTYKLRDEIETLRKMLDASKLNGDKPVDGIKGRIRFFISEIVCKLNSLQAAICNSNLILHSLNLLWL